MKNRFKNFSLPQRVVLVLSLFAYFLSFKFSAYTVMDFDGRKSLQGVEVFFMGSTAILGGGLLEWIIWLANPLFILSIVLKFKGVDKAKRYCIASVVLALSFLFWKNILVAENGRTAIIESRGTGYFLWLFSLVVWSVVFAFDKFRVFNQRDAMQNRLDKRTT